MLAKYDASNPAALKRLVTSGAKLQPFPPAVMDACLSAAIDVYRDVATANSDFKKVWDSVLAFRNDQYLWLQVAEYTYDTFLIRNRTHV
jgi:TRAP-type mannitol/chloroaromatic compound transport system substrate-binding protein